MFNRYGRITVLCKKSSEESFCVCDCGNFMRVNRPSRLKQTHCGCLTGQEFINKTFGQLKVLSISPEKRYSNLDFICICLDCGEISKRKISKNTKSLKCKKCKRSGEKSKLERFTYSSYKNMIQRCTNPNTKFYSSYGGKGITVCQSWLESFDNFFNEMGRRPENTSLDRIDWEKGYSRENCRWVDHSEQVRNRGKVSSLYSRYRGVSYDKQRSKFIAFIQFEQKTIFLGRFESELEAAKAYNNKLLNLGLETKYLNII